MFWENLSVLMDSPETSVRFDHYTLRNSPEERSSHLLCGGSLKSSVIKTFPVLFGKMNFHCRVHRSQPLVSILRHVNPIDAIANYLQA
jgi:hypothetical protein